MKHLKLVCAVAGMMAMSMPQVTKAEDKKAEPHPSREETREKFQNLSPEEREAKRKEFMEKGGEKNREEMKKMVKTLGLDSEELKKLPPEERRAKVKEASDKKLAELQKKKTAGTITEEEKQTLQQLEQMKRMMEQYRGGDRPKPKTEKPADK